MPIAPLLEECQPRFMYYMLANNIKPGDDYALHKYLIWASKMIANYKKSIRKKFYDTLTPQEQLDFTEFIKECVDNEKDNVANR